MGSQAERTHGKAATGGPIEVAAGGIPSLTGELVGETYRVLERTHTHLLGTQHQKGPICLWVAGEVTENRQRAEQVPLFPFRSLPHVKCHNVGLWVALPW